MADIADELGLSVPTISRALRDHPDVGVKTKETVRAVADRLGYRISPAGRALRTGRYDTISFVIPLNLIGWWEPLLRGAGHAAAINGFRLTLNPVDDAYLQSMNDQAPLLGDDLTSFFARSAGQPIDGFVVVSPTDDDWKPTALATGAPVVIIDDLRPHPGFHVWASENHDSAKDGIVRLISSGRKRIVALSPTSAFTGLALDERLAGYTEAMEDAGLEPLILDSDETYPASHLTSNAIDGLLEAGREFDGVFCPVDFAAFAVIRSLRRAGLTVPEDVAVLGFDGDPAALALDPPLSTVAQRFDEIGAGAVTTLIDLIRSDDSDKAPAAAPRTHLIPPVFIERSST